MRHFNSLLVAAEEEFANCLNIEIKTNARVFAMVRGIGAVGVNRFTNKNCLEQFGSLLQT